MDIVDLLQSEYGNIASTIALLVVAASFARRQLLAYKVKADEREEYYALIKEFVSSLAVGATTATRRQDVFFFANETLARGRHEEIRNKINAVVIMLVSIFTSACSIYQLVTLDIPILFTLFQGGALLFLWHSVFNMFRLQKQLRKLNDSFSDGYLNSITRHIKKQHA